MAEEINNIQNMENTSNEDELSPGQLLEKEQQKLDDLRKKREAFLIKSKSDERETRKKLSGLLRKARTHRIILVGSRMIAFFEKAGDFDLMHGTEKEYNEAMDKYFAELMKRNVLPKLPFKGKSPESKEEEANNESS